VIRLSVGLLVLLTSSSLAYPETSLQGHLEAIIPHFLGTSVEPRTLVQDDITLAGRAVLIEGTVYGDVLAFGESARFPGTIVGDIQVVARTVEIAGTIYDDVRVLSGEATMSTFVASNLDACCRSLHLSPGSEVGGSVSIVTGDCEALGGIVGDLRGAGRRITIDGHIGGDVELVVGEALTLLEGARIDGDLRYVSYDPAVVAEGAHVAGNIQQTIPPDAPRRILNQYRILRMALWLLALIALAAVLVTVAPNIAHKTAQAPLAHPFRTLGASLIVLAVLPLSILMLTASIVGIPLAVLVAALGLTLFCLSPLFLSLVLGRSLIRLASRSSEPSPYLSLAAGFPPTAILMSLSSTRTITWIAAAIIGLGALALSAWQQYLKARRSSLV
jgi:hypothetical protein